MRTLYLLLTVLFLSFIPQKNKIKKIDNLQPVYITVKNLGVDDDDEISLSFKNILTGYKFKFIKREEYLKLYNQYTQDILAAQRNIPNSEMSKYSTKEYMEKIFRVGGTTQKLSIVYKTGDNTSVSYEECDSVGFILTLTPFSVHTSKNKSVFMFSMKEVGTRHPDKIAGFLVSKLE